MHITNLCVTCIFIYIYIYNTFIVVRVFIMFTDIALYTLWGVLSIAGFLVQFYREKNRPQFPERAQRRRTEPRARALPTRRPRTNDGADVEQSERQPLLSPAAANRASVGMQQAASDTWNSGNVASAPTLPEAPPPYSATT